MPEPPASCAFTVTRTGPFELSHPDGMHVIPPEGAFESFAKPRLRGLLDAPAPLVDVASTLGAGGEPFVHE